MGERCNVVVTVSALLLCAAACSGTPGESVGDTTAAYSANNMQAIDTIAYSPNSYVIGNAYPGWTAILHGEAVFRSGPGNPSGSDYQCGFLYGEAFVHCGWVDRHEVSGYADRDGCGSECPVDYDTDLFRATYTDGTINPGASDGQETHMHYAGSGCSDTRGYGNVSPWRVPATPANSLGVVPDGKLLLWRYVSKDGQWVLVRDPDSSPGVPNWYFVHRGCVSLAPPSSPLPPSPPPSPPAPPATELHCCALCRDRELAYHADASGKSCKDAAIDFCSINGRGGVNEWYEGTCPEAP